MCVPSPMVHFFHLRSHTCRTQRIGEQTLEYFTGERWGVWGVWDMHTLAGEGDEGGRGEGRGEGGSEKRKGRASALAPAGTPSPKVGWEMTCTEGGPAQLVRLHTIRE